MVSFFFLTIFPTLKNVEKFLKIAMISLENGDFSTANAIYDGLWFLKRNFFYLFSVLTHTLD